MELSPEEEARMWRENCRKLNIELQAEQQKRIWFENRYNEIISAFQTLQAAQQQRKPDANKVVTNKEVKL